MSDSTPAPRAPASPAAPDSGPAFHDIPTFAMLAADPEIAPLLGFVPVVRQVKRPDGWTPELQRELIARLAATGKVQAAARQMGKHVTGAEALYKVAAADSFRLAWDAALIIGRRRNGLDRAPPFAGPVLGITRRSPAGRSSGPGANRGPLPDQVLNEFGEWEDEESLNRRADEARDNASRKLLLARRLYLAEIRGCPGKRAAFEILTELPIDWAKAAKVQPRDDEPWKQPRMRKPDMLLTAEAGWLGAVAHGRDKKAELRAAVDKYHAEQGLDPVDWSESEAGCGQAKRRPRNDEAGFTPAKQTSIHQTGESRCAPLS